MALEVIEQSPLIGISTQGRPGRDGIDGRNGRDGRNGVDGADGLTVALSMAGRPGDYPQLFTVDLAAGQTRLPPGMSPQITTSGRALRIVGAAIVATGDLMPIEDNRTYKARLVVRRARDTDDPAGDGLIFGAAWYGAEHNLLSRSPLETFSVAEIHGRQQVQVLIGRGYRYASPPVSAVYLRVYLQTFGDTPVTDLEVLEIADVSDADIVSLDADDLANRLSAVEAAQMLRPPAGLGQAFVAAMIFG